MRRLPAVCDLRFEGSPARPFSGCLLPLPALGFALAFALSLLSGPLLLPFEPQAFAFRIGGNAGGAALGGGLLPFMAAGLHRGRELIASLPRPIRNPGYAVSRAIAHPAHVVAHVLQGFG